MASPFSLDDLKPGGRLNTKTEPGRPAPPTPPAEQPKAAPPPPAQEPKAAPPPEPPTPSAPQQAKPVAPPVPLPAAPASVKPLRPPAEPVPAETKAAPLNLKDLAPGGRLNPKTKPDSPASPPPAQQPQAAPSGTLDAAPSEPSPTQKAEPPKAPPAVAPVAPPPKSAPPASPSSPPATDAKPTAAPQVGRPQKPEPSKIPPAAAKTATGGLEDVAANQLFVINLRTGEVVYEKNADQKILAGSSTKLMTMAVMLKNGGTVASAKDLKNALTYSDNDLTTTLAAEWMASKGAKFMREHGVNTTDQELRALAERARSVIAKDPNTAASRLNTKGANRNLRTRIDELYSPLMNETAKDIGMNQSRFTNTAGAYWWGTVSPTTTARDMGTLNKFINDTDPGFMGRNPDPRSPHHTAHAYLTPEGAPRGSKHGNQTIEARKVYETREQQEDIQGRVVAVKTSTVPGSKFPKPGDDTYGSEAAKYMRANFPGGNAAINIHFKGKDEDTYHVFVGMKDPARRPYLANSALKAVDQKISPRPAPHAQLLNTPRPNSATL